MATSVIGFAGEPLAVTRMSLPVHEYWHDIQTLNRRINKLLAERGTPFYRIYDARSIVDLDFSDILLWIAEEKEHIAGSLFDPRVRAIIAGSSPMILLAAKKFQERCCWTIPVLPTLEQALACARAHIATASATTPDECLQQYA